MHKLFKLLFKIFKTNTDYKFIFNFQYTPTFLNSIRIQIIFINSFIPQQNLIFFADFYLVLALIYDRAKKWYDLIAFDIQSLSIVEFFRFPFINFPSPFVYIASTRWSISVSNQQFVSALICLN